MGIGSVIKKKIFDIAKDSKAIRVVLRSERDALYRAKMVLDDPFVKIDDRLPIRIKERQSVQSIQ